MSNWALFPGSGLAPSSGCCYRCSNPADLRATRMRAVAALDAPRSVEALLSFGLVARRRTFAETLGLIPHQPLVIVRQRRFGDFTGTGAVRPVRRAYGGEA